jgi:putative component of membrane protein insertase Oxa1/YidC/SpoIIIJ protein YidD
MSIARRVALLVIDTYQRDVSPRRAGRCPFEPSCSEYSRLAFERYGALRATRMTIGRLRRCAPGYEGSFVDEPIAR